MQNQNKKKVRHFFNASKKQRIICLYIFIIVAVWWGFFQLAGRGIIPLNRIYGECGLKQKYDFPCPGCGFLHSMTAFSRGRIKSAFLHQPAAAIFSFIITLVGLFALLTAAFGVYFPLSGLFSTRLKTLVVIVGIAVIWILGWLWVIYHEVWTK